MMADMGHLQVAHVDYYLPDGRMLLSDVSFRVGSGDVTALVGPNGAGKSTLLKIIAGELKPDEGTVTTSGGLRVMPQFVGSVRDDRTVRDLLVSVARPAVRDAARAVDAAELAIMERDDEAAQLAYAQALSDWADAGGYAAETIWDMCTTSALGVPYEQAQWREVRTLSGGEQKRLVLEALLRGPDEVLLLDEPDNYLDVPGKRWLEERLGETAKTVLFVSHDRELLARAAAKIVSVEPAPGGSDVWVHGGGFGTFHEARRQRFERFEELRRRWDEKHAQLKRLVLDMQQYAARSDEMASRYQAAKTRLRKFEEAGPPQAPPRRQDIRMRLRGGRTGVRAITCSELELTGLMRPFNLEVFYGERVAVLGSNGSGKSHFLRLLAGQQVAHTGSWKLGARVVPGHFAQTHAHPELDRRSLTAILWEDHAKDRGAAMGVLRRYELDRQGDQAFGRLSGGQQARFQILLLELAGATALLLDEPTDNLDLESAEALQDGLESYEGTVLAVTHDRWFARSFDRFLIFGADGVVREALEPVWDEGRVDRAS
jgi:ATPase subunit of ABC transporter with duplicated ATPase domains